MKRLTSVALLFFVTIAVSLAQEVPVNLNTDAATVSIPLYTHTAHDLSHPVGIYYQSTGLKLQQEIQVFTESYTVGWSAIGLQVNFDSMQNVTDIRFGVDTGVSIALFGGLEVSIQGGIIYAF